MKPVTLSGCFFITWVKDQETGILKPYNQGIINEVLGDKVFVTLFNWIDGRPSKHQIMDLEYIKTYAEIHVEHDDFLIRADKISTLALR